MKKALLSLSLLCALALPAFSQGHSVTLTWTKDPSNSANVSFILYRAVGNCPGATTNPPDVTPAPPPTFVTLGNTTGLTATDTSVTGGVTYCFLVSALDNGSESPGGATTGLGNPMVQVTIPTTVAVPTKPPTNLKETHK